MSDEPVRPLEREGARFFGAIGAGLSHELSNVFNIINELSGLQQDILSAAAQGGTAGLARVNDLAARIKAQVGRGEEINRSLHRLSHSVDEPDATFDLGETLALFASLAAREARLAEVAFEVRPPETPMAHRGDPFALLLVLHACLRAAIAAAASERRIEVLAEKGPDGTRVVVCSADPIIDFKSDASGAAMLEAGCAALAVVPRLEQAPGGGYLIVLNLGSESTEPRSRG
jgi:signal transduction histidine kinase